MPVEELSLLLRGSGTYRRKAEYLQGVWAYMAELSWNGTPGSVTLDTVSLRKGLLSIKGVGPETADCILLYVLERPIFVVDAYTRRILPGTGSALRRLPATIFRSFSMMPFLPTWECSTSSTPCWLPAPRGSAVLSRNVRGAPFANSALFLIFPLLARRGAGAVERGGLETVVLFSGPWVRIPPPPPGSHP